MPDTTPENAVSPVLHPADEPLAACAASPVEGDVEQPGIERPSNSRKARGRAVFGAKLAIAGLLVWWLVRTHRFEPGALLQVRSFAALLGVLLLQGGIVAGQSARWKLLLEARGLTLSWRDALQLGLAGQFAAVWTPAGLGLDGVRIIDGTRRFPARRAEVLKAAALDRVLAVAALGALCVPGAVWLLRRELSPAACALYLAVLMALAAVAPRRRRPQAWAFIVALGVHLSNVGAVSCAFMALGKGVSFAGVAGAAPLVVLSSMVPLTPLGIGVVDGAAAELFRRAAMTGGAESTMLGRAVWIVLSLGCGGVLMKGSRRPVPARDAAGTNGMENE